MPDFRHRAACRGTDPELFFPIGTGKPYERQLEQARAVCRPCPVRIACLSWAVATGFDHGVIGALTPEERAKLPRPTAPVQVPDDLTGRERDALVAALASGGRFPTGISGSTTAALVADRLATRERPAEGTTYTRLTPAGRAIAALLVPERTSR